MTEGRGAGRVGEALVRRKADPVVTCSDAEPLPPVAVTTDLVILTVRPPRVYVLLIERAHDPFAGCWALPGGFVEPDQDLIDAARHTLVDKTGIEVAHAHLEQLASFGRPDRDPRMRVISVAYLAMVADPPAAIPGRDAKQAEWVDIDAVERPALAFDHADVLAAGIERAKAKLEYTTLATSFCGAEFTIGELRAVYEAVWGTTLDPANFHRKVMASAGFVVPTGATSTRTKGRPAKTYRAGSAEALVPPLQR